MRFQHAALNASYVVRPRVVVSDPITNQPVERQKPLRAKFKGAQRIFDSMTAQAALGWTDEERIAVERHLLTHPDFARTRNRGRGGLYLAPGEEVPAVHADLIATDEVLEAPKVTAGEVCIFVTTAPDELIQCDQPALEGESYCQNHLDQIRAAEGAPPRKTRAKAVSAV